MCDWRKLLRRVKSRPEIDRGQKIGIFHSNPLHRALIQNRPKTGKNVDFSDRTGFFEKISRAACSSHRQASKTPLFDVVYPDTSIQNFSRLVPRNPNLAYYSTNLVATTATAAATLLNLVSS
jgi:hypothetical protein